MYDKDSNQDDLHDISLNPNSKMMNNFIVDNLNNSNQSNRDQTIHQSQYNNKK